MTAQADQPGLFPPDGVERHDRPAAPRPPTPAQLDALRVAHRHGEGAIYTSAAYGLIRLKRGQYPEHLDPGVFRVLVDRGWIAKGRTTERIKGMPLTFYPITDAGAAAVAAGTRPRSRSRA